MGFIWGTIKPLTPASCRCVNWVFFPTFSSKEPSQQRVKKWGFSLEEALKDPAGQELFLKFLESEFSSENLR